MFKSLKAPEIRKVENQTMNHEDVILTRSPGPPRKLECTCLGAAAEGFVEQVGAKLGLEGGQI